MKPASTFMGIVLVAFFAYSLGGCPTPPAPKPPPCPADVHLDTDSGIEEPKEDGAATFPACVRACAKLKEFGCPEAETLQGGRTCYAVCAFAEASKKETLGPGCVADARNVAEVRACKTVRCMK